MTYRYRRASRAAAVAAAVVLLSAGCAGSTAPAVPAQVEKHNLTIAAVPVADSAALYIAKQKGFFRAEGLSVKIVTAVSGATAIASQLAGKYDAVLGNYVSYILADAQHSDQFRVLAPGSALGPSDSMLLIPPGSPIRSIADLKNKTIGVNALDNIGTLLLSSVLADNAMQVKADHVRFKAIPFPEMTHALLTHQVDAAWLVEPFVTYAAMAGCQLLADTDQGLTEKLSIAGYMVTQRWEQRYPKTAAAPRRALLKGQYVAATRPQAVWRGLERFAAIPASAAQIIALPSYPLQITPSALQRVADLMFSFYMLDRSFNASQLTNVRVLE